MRREGVIFSSRTGSASSRPARLDSLSSTAHPGFIALWRCRHQQLGQRGLRRGVGQQLRPSSCRLVGPQGEQRLAVLSFTLLVDEPQLLLLLSSARPRRSVIRRPRATTTPGSAGSSSSRTATARDDFVALDVLQLLQHLVVLLSCDLQQVKGGGAKAARLARVASSVGSRQQ